jgi:uncharacterized protein YkwD
MKKSQFLLLGMLFVFNMNAQTQWDYSQYKKVDFTNFRTNPLFLQEFDASNPDYPLLNATLFFMINEQRAMNRILPLEHHFACEIAAYNHAVKMVEQEFFAHRNPIDKTRYAPFDRGLLAGVANPNFAENIAYHYPRQGYTYVDVGDMFFDSWMNSPGHKSNILSKNGLEAGCGTYVKGDAIYAVQVFKWFDKVKLKEAVDKLPLLKDGSVPVLEP